MTEKVIDCKEEQKGWKAELCKVKKDNIGTIVTWYEEGLDDRYSLKALTKPQKDYYRDLLKNIFNDCKNPGFLDYLITEIKSSYGKQNYKDLIVLLSLNYYFELDLSDECGKIELSINNLYNYLDIFSTLENCKILFNNIMINDILNTGKYMTLFDIRESIDSEEIPKNIYSNELFNQIVLSVYKDYYKDFKPDNIFKTKEQFWKTYLQIVSDFPFRKVGEFNKTPIEVPKSVYIILSDFIGKQTTDLDKKNLFQAFLEASIQAKSKIWNVKKNIETQFYNFLDFFKYDGNRVFYSYNFRNDLNRKIGSETLDDSELAAIDKCLYNKKEAFSTFIYFIQASTGKTKKEILDSFKKDFCPEIEYPSNKNTTTLATGATNPINAAAAEALGTVTNTVTSTASSAASAVASAAKDVLSPNNSFLNTTEYRDEVLPELITFLKLNSVYLQDKSIEEIIKFVKESGPPKVKALLSKQGDNKILRAVIRTVFQLNTSNVQKGCSITSEIIENFIDNYMEKEVGCEFSEANNNYRNDTSMFKSGTIGKNASLINYMSYSFGNNSSDVIAKIIQAVLFSIFRKYRYTTRSCRLDIAKKIEANLNRCYSKGFNILDTLSSIFKRDIIVIIKQTGKFIYTKYGDYNQQICISTLGGVIESVAFGLPEQNLEWIKTAGLFKTEPYSEHFLRDIDMDTSNKTSTSSTSSTNNNNI